MNSSIQRALLLSFTLLIAVEARGQDAAQVVPLDTVATGETVVYDGNSYAVISGTSSVNGKPYRFLRGQITLQLVENGGFEIVQTLADSLGLDVIATLLPDYFLLYARPDIDLEASILALRAHPLVRNAGLNQVGRFY